ncbi:MAG: tyrosine-type recombinase/integrase [Prevotella sp.]|nr:tyrosine-type recombinase/integrase [Prevotella sp.]
MIVEDFLRYMQAEREASPLTVATYKDALDDYTAFLKTVDDNINPEDADSDIVRNWVENMMDRGYKATYTCKKLSAVKSLYRYALRRGIIRKDPAHGVTGPKKEKVLPVFLKEAEADRLFDEEQWDREDIRSLRARTLLLLLYSTGIRRAEVVALRDRDVNLVTHEMKVTGKRRKQRIVPLGDEISREIAQYMALRDEQLPATDDSEALFRNDKGRKMSDGTVYKIVHENLSRVTTQKKRSPHVLRHSFATAMLNHDAKLGSVQKLLGHESLDTTQIYTHVTFEELKRSYSKAHPRESGDS